MKTSRLITGTVSAAFLAAGLFYGAVANAETTELGQQGRLDTNGVVQGWTISDLKKSTDVVDYPIKGTLWEATATDEAIAGNVLPIISNLNARSASGENYRVLFQIASPQGVKPGALAQGEKTSGKIYFDVTGEAPNSVVYNDGSEDLIVWVQPAPKPAAPRSTGTGSTPAPAATAPEAEAAEAEGTEAEGAEAEGTEATEAEATSAEPAEEPVTGRQGTPLPEEAATEATPETVTETAPESTTAETEAPVEGTPHGPRSATGSQGTPIEEGAPHGAAATTTAVATPAS